MKSTNKGILTLILVLIIAFGVVCGVKFLAPAQTVSDGGHGNSQGGGGSEEGGGTSAEPLSYTPGTYYGVGKGSGEIIVKVTFTEDAITEVDVLEYSHESAGYREEPVAKLPGMIVAANSWDVDVVSESTVTSKGILSAVENAALQAAGQLEIYEYTGE